MFPHYVLICTCDKDLRFTIILLLSLNTYYFFYFSHDILGGAL